MFFKFCWLILCNTYFQNVIYSGNWQSDSTWYRSDTIFGEEAYLTTAYFVEPEVICSTGRTQSEFDVEGTGNCLLFQNGPSTHDLIKVPLDLDSADGSVSIFILFHGHILKLFFWQLRFESNLAR